MQIILTILLCVFLKGSAFCFFCKCDARKHAAARKGPAGGRIGWLGAGAAAPLLNLRVVYVWKLRDLELVGQWAAHAAYHRREQPTFRVRAIERVCERDGGLRAIKPPAPTSNLSEWNRESQLTGGLRVYLRDKRHRDIPERCRDPAARLGEG